MVDVSLIGKEDIVRNLAAGFGFRRDRGSIAGDGRKRQCAGAGDHVERDGDHLRPQKSNGGDEREVCEEASKRGANCVGGVESRDSGRCDRDVLSHQVTNQQRERASHQDRDWQQEHDCDPDTHDVRHQRWHVPAVCAL